jgi:DNA repair protein RecN (Recombination protein N)
MLLELHIQNFAIIDDVHLEFTEGFNVITGETGAGKSILIDAVGVVTGAQADRNFVRAGADKAVIEATFQVPEHLHKLYERLFDANEIDYDVLDEVMLSREIRANGRNVARINGSPCKVAVFREVAQFLLNLHGQSDNIALLQPRSHIYLLDRYANLEGTRNDLGELVRELQAIRRQIASLQQDEAATARRVEMLEYQVAEIEGAQLKPNEDDDLKQESNLLANSEKLLSLATRTEQLLIGDEVEDLGAAGMLEEAADLLAQLAILDDSLKPLAELVETINIEMEELVDGVSTYTENADVPPGRLDQVEARLAEIQSLKRKYGGSLEDVIAYAERARAELDDIQNSEERAEELAHREHELLIQIGEVSLTLSTQRKTAAERLARLVEEELSDLRMGAGKFSVKIEHVEDDENGCIIDDKRYKFDATGIDQIEFLLATNVGEPLKPLAKVASGGEAARAMLALMNVLSQADRTPTMIFDEVDAGIGGRLGTVVGEKLWRISTAHQVLCITHLAQLASFSDIHFRVVKDVVKERTVTVVTRLDPAQRLLELADMLGSETSSARQNARDLLHIAQQIKAGQKAEVSS